MSKALLLIIGLVACTIAISPFEKVKDLVAKDQCGLHGMETLKPKIQNKLSQIKANPSNFLARTQLLSMIQDVKQVYEHCNIHKKTQPVLGDIIQKSGYSFLLASNCFKDVGALLLIADQIVQDPTNIAQDAVILIFLYVLGRQGVVDCQQFINYIL